MTAILGVSAILLVYGGPVAIGAWGGSRVSRGWLAFVLGWGLTPVAGFVLAFIVESIAYSADPRRSGGGLMVIVLPVICLFTGIVGGALAGLIVHLRNQKNANLTSAGAPSGVTTQP